MRFGTQNPWPEYIPMVVMCPLVRSNTTNTNGLTALKLNLYKYWGSTFTCYAQSADQNGSVLKRVAKSTTQTGLISLDWSNLLNTSSAKGTYGVSCDVIGALESNQWGDELESIEYTEP
jgi:hypothetical protein